MKKKIIHPKNVAVALSVMCIYIPCDFSSEEDIFESKYHNKKSCSDIGGEIQENAKSLSGLVEWQPTFARNVCHCII